MELQVQEEQFFSRRIGKATVLSSFRDPVSSTFLRKQRTPAAVLMDVFSANWLTEMELEDPTFIHQYSPMQSLGDSLDEFDFKSFSSENFSSYPSSSPKTSNPYLFDSIIENVQTGGVERPRKQLKTTSGKFCPTASKTPEASSSSSSCLISFGNSDLNPIPDDTLTFYGNLNWNGKPKDRAAANGNMNLETLISQDSYQKQDHSPTYGQGTKSLSSTRNPSQNKEHVIAERKRREKLNLQFIALSAIIPGLKKTDKASVLGDAVKYLKQLQERVKMLEDQTTKKMVESVVTVKRYQLSDNETSLSYHDSDSSSKQPLLEIEARVSNKDVLIRIHCQKQKGFAVKILGEVEKLHLTVINSSFTPFGDYIMDITIVAQMDNGFCTTAKDLVKKLRLAFLQFM
ncbi:hypothetical protein PVL29_026733 [Vitis rotundifolia]|uniref:BHLH domain-containing protein n=1 Tax=Vitis rotundifolia TaxID=103349 RepID=A0AA39D5V1_VITRO|nr:hypothetical protein PVL29_026733 [Vitis rotundifolia]